MMDVEIPLPIRYSGSEIAEIRKSVFMSQEVFARLLGVTSSSVSKWETEKMNPSTAVCRLLKIIADHGIEGILYE